MIVIGHHVYMYKGRYSQGPSAPNYTYVTTMCDIDVEHLGVDILVGNMYNMYSVTWL